MSVGRLDIDEFGERSAKVTAAKTRGELAEVFDDLPQPHPQLDGPPPGSARPAAVAATSAAERGHPAMWTDRPLNQRLTAAAVPLAWVAGIALFLSLGGWMWILLPVLFTAVGRGLWGHDWEHDYPYRDRGRRHEFRDRQRHRRPDWDR
jgi:hypothetical protein